MESTMKLRWSYKKRTIYHNNELPVVEKYTVLQQWWERQLYRQDRNGNYTIPNGTAGEWRDVPIEVEE